MAAVSAKEIKNRIRSMQSTRQITKAMELVAASKLRHAQIRAFNSRPYFELLYATVTEIAESGHDLTSPYLVARDVKNTLYVIIAGDRGLAGGYNSNILKLAMAEADGKSLTVVPIGKKAVDYCRGRGIPMLTGQYGQAAEMSAGDCFALAKRLAEDFREGRFDEIAIGYTNFVSALCQTPSILRLLPLLQSPGGKRAARDILYEPDSTEVFDRIVPEYLGGILYGALCESRAAEQAARRTAMDAATQNADDMIAQLSLSFNQARQAAITREITEIVAGSKM